MHNYSVKAINNTFTLFINDAPAACPFTPPLVAVTQMGQQNIQRFPCSSNCPLVNVSEPNAENQVVYTCYCGSGTRTINAILDTPAQQTPKNNILTSV